MWVGEQMSERGIGNGISSHYLSGHRRSDSFGNWQCFESLSLK